MRLLAKIYIRDPLFSQSRQSHEIRKINGTRTIWVLQYIIHLIASTAAATVSLLILLVSF